jgi:hypothetical protein
MGDSSKRSAGSLIILSSETGAKGKKEEGNLYVFLNPSARQFQILEISSLYPVGIAV